MAPDGTKAPSLDAVAPAPPQPQAAGRSNEARGRKLSIVVACFNEEEVIAATHARISRVLQCLGMDYEILFVDDGSRDRTAVILADICRTDMHARAIRLARNFGQQIAIAAGLGHADGDAVIIIDADLQDPPEVIPQFVAQWQAGAHIVQGQRLDRAGESLFKRISAHGFYRVINWLSDIPISLDTGEFRLLDRMVVDTLNAMPERYRLLRGLVGWVGYRTTIVQFNRDARFAGTTKFSTARMLSLAIDGIVSFSVIPLRFLTALGLLMFMFSVLGIIYAVILRLMTDFWVPGWTLQFASQLLLGGLNLLGLGILGEYIGRIYGESKQRPLYIVMEELRHPASALAPAQVTMARVNERSHRAGGPIRDENRR